MSVFKDLTGQRFGKLVTIERVGTKRACALWKCKCDCGNEAEVTSHSLISGNAKSCGCIQREAVTTHGMSNTKIFNIWKGIKQRCLDHNCKNFLRYGARGITICDEWKDFIPFYIWAMNNGYLENLSIDRVNNNGNYEPSNCKFSTMKEQANNTRRNVWYEYNGVTKTIAQWSDVCGITRVCLYQRFKAGWSIEKALFTPIEIHKRTGKDV